MNADLYADAMSIAWDDLVAEYLKHMKLVRRAAVGHFLLMGQASDFRFIPATKPSDK